MRIPNFSLFTGTANPELATAIALTTDEEVSRLLAAAGHDAKCKEGAAV